MAKKINYITTKKKASNFACGKGKTNFGAGAGYEIKSVLEEITKYKNCKVVDFDEGYRTFTIEGDISAKFAVESASSYYYGGDLSGYIEEQESGIISKIEYQYFYDDKLQRVFGIKGDIEKFLDKHTTEELIKKANVQEIMNDICNDAYDIHITTFYGGGWSHVKYDGTIADKTSDITSDSGGIVNLEATITNADDISLIDAFVQYDFWEDDEETDTDFSIKNGKGRKFAWYKYSKKYQTDDNYTDYGLVCLERQKSHRGTYYVGIDVSIPNDNNKEDFTYKSHFEVERPSDLAHNGVKVKPDKRMLEIEKWLSKNQFSIIDDTKDVLRATGKLAGNIVKNTLYNGGILMF